MQIKIIHENVLKYFVYFKSHYFSWPLRDSGTEEESLNWKTSAHVPKNTTSRHYKTLTLQPTDIWKYPEIFITERPKHNS